MQVEDCDTGFSCTLRAPFLGDRSCGVGTKGEYKSLRAGQKKFLSFSELRERAQFPFLRRLGEVVDGRERGWAELMYIESQAVLSTMIALMHRRVPRARTIDHSGKSQRIMV